MKILAIDTSTNAASCAVIDDEKLIGEFTINDKITHSQKLLPMISQLLKSANIDINEIDVFAVANGPGSFTGLRIGVATINGLAQATNKPVVGVSSLESLAKNVVDSKRLIVSLIDARRDRAFVGIYRAEKDLETVLSPDVLELEEIINILKEKQEDIIFVGEGTDIYKEKLKQELGDKAYFVPKNLNIAKASSTAEIAFKKASEGNTQSYFELGVEYLRESQAQRELDEKMRKRS